MGIDFEFDIEIRFGVGVFVCGEEIVLMILIEGYRGELWLRLLFLVVKGLWGKFILFNNVEIYVNILVIILKGLEWFVLIGIEKSKGIKVFVFVGKVNNIGFIEVLMGIIVREIVEDIGGGIFGGKKFKVV